MGSREKLLHAPAEHRWGDREGRGGNNTENKKGIGGEMLLSVVQHPGREKTFADASSVKDEGGENGTDCFFRAGLFFFVLEFPSCTPRWGEGRVTYDFGFFLSPVASKVWLSFSFLCVGESGGILRN